MTLNDISFGSIADFRNGLNYSRENMGIGLKVISVGSFGDRMSPDYNSIGEIDPTGVAGDDDLLNEGDILFVRSNGNRELVARVMYITSPPHPVAYSGFCIRARMNKDTVNPKFYYYVFRSKETRMRLVTGGVGANIVNVSQNTLKRFEVPYPSLDIQDKCVFVLSAYDDLIAANQRRIQLLEESARLLYREWFVKLRFPGHETVAVVDGMPEGWSKRPLGELADVIMGQSPESKHFNDKGEGLPFHQGVTGFGERFVIHSTFTTHATRLAQPGDILCSVRAPVGRINVSLDKIVIGRGLSAMRSNLNTQSLLFYQLKNLFFQEDLIGGGAIFASVGKKELFGQELLQPSEQIASAFENFASNIDQQIEALSLQVQRLQEARDLLLPKLMSGALDVSRLSPPP
jgi:type I restriction enzyme, S subunit